MTVDQWLQEAENHLDANRYQQALTAYEQAIRLDPSRTYAYARKGQVLSILNRYQEALEAYGQALQLAPNTALLHVLKGDALYSCERYAEALAAIELALQLDPNVTTGHGSKGQVLEALKRYPEALVAYEQAIRMNASTRLRGEHFLKQGSTTGRCQKMKWKRLVETGLVFTDHLATILFHLSQLNSHPGG